MKEDSNHEGKSKTAYQQEKTMTGSEIPVQTTNRERTIIEIDKKHTRMIGKGYRQGGVVRPGLSTRFRGFGWG